MPFAAGGPHCNHRLQRERGLKSAGPTWAEDVYEEFAAIVVSNVYRSELKITQLRQDHHGFLPLTGPDTAAASFKTTYQQYLNDMAIEQPQLCRNLRRVPSAFNPFV